MILADYAVRVYKETIKFIITENINIENVHIAIQEYIVFFKLVYRNAYTRNLKCYDEILHILINIKNAKEF